MPAMGLRQTLLSSATGAAAGLAAGRGAGAAAGTRVCAGGRDVAGLGRLRLGDLDLDLVHLAVNRDLELQG